MSLIPTMHPLKNKKIATTAALLGLLTGFGSIALAAQDRFTLKAPNGIAFSEFRGYEDWADVAVSRTEDGIKVIAANPAMIEAYRSGTPGNGKLFSWRSPRWQPLLRSRKRQRSRRSARRTSNMSELQRATSTATAASIFNRRMRAKFVQGDT